MSNDASGPSSRHGRLKGKVAIITGATSGIGRVTAELFCSEGADLILVARAKPRPADQVDCAFEFVEGDVSDPATAAAAVTAARNRGGPHVLINNAGIDLTGDLLQTDPSDFRRVIEVNLFGAFLMLREAARAMKAHGGAVVNVTSRTASVGVRGMTAYGASKGALLSLTRGAAVELAPFGIRVNAVAPGLTETPMIASWISKQNDPLGFRRQLEASIPLNRLGQTKDVAAAILYPAADESAYVTGASLAVDGGYIAS